MVLNSCQVVTRPVGLPNLSASPNSFCQSHQLQQVSLKSTVFNFSFPVKLKMMYIGEEQSDSPDGTSAATK